MVEIISENPFHAGEIEAQSRAGVEDVAQWAGGFIRDHLPEQHRAFHKSLPFLVMAGADTEGRTWVTLVDGEDGFIQSPDAKSLTLATDVDDGDPLAAALEAGTDIGVIGIELATRRRNRFSGRARKSESGYKIDISQTFGNCPQYIHERAWTRVERGAPGLAIAGTTLTPSQVALIQSADTLFIGSGHQSGDDVPSRGYDASHRGGAPGFVRVSDSGHLHIPDYAGNNFFNTIGNLLIDPRIGLVFVDFETGTLLHVTGRAIVDWEPQNSHDFDAWRMINVEIDAVVERPGAVALRWTKQDHLLHRLRVKKRVAESSDITSFYLSSADDRRLPPFEAGQHLPIEVQVPGQVGVSKRSYSLSGEPGAGDGYRLSIKREDKGLVSRFFHDQIREGSFIQASQPAGDFVIPCGKCPLVLVSAGVGVTPMIAMLHAAKAANGSRPVWFVHGSRNGKEHALREDVDALLADYPAAQQQVFYSRPEDGDSFDKRGRITGRSLLELGVGSDAHYMLCGPARFLSEIKRDLEAGGVPASNIHFETFVPSV
ncbi:pyridoxamine 5'-phosphate oxidase family protein [uncultured Tateyamaria sp.]|uniref:FAD-binding oxidoreductase n=1 Tax=uncultured Tateyamaria sp. TaxID=455651 RepID=UPI002610ADB5|nr:pyridoxamine 5'-phosphate oxidase family protein [uncultured Tateyamaria sp.]